MQFQTIFVAAALATSVLAKVRTKAICIIENKDGDKIFHAIATCWACDEYKKRNSGKEFWDTCPDCVYVGSEPPYCGSKAQHIGGKEWSEYCKKKGATKGLANEGFCE